MLTEQTAELGEAVAPFILGYLARWRPYKPGWVYEDGIIFKGALDLGRATGDTAFLDFVNERVGPRIAPDGAIDGYDGSEFNIDNICAGKVLFTLFENSGEVRFLRAIERQMHAVGQLLAQADLSPPGLAGWAVHGAAISARLRRARGAA